MIMIFLFFEIVQENRRIKELLIYDFGCIIIIEIGWAGRRTKSYSDLTQGTRETGSIEC